MWNGGAAGNTLLVMEYMSNGNLWDNLQHDSCNEFRWHKRWVQTRPVLTLRALLLDIVYF